MKINYVLFGTKLTGGVRVLLEIANGLSKKGHDVEITALGKESDSAWFDLKAKIHYSNISHFEKAICYFSEKIFNFNIFPHNYVQCALKAIPECDINVATGCYTAYSVFESNRGLPFYHMQHYEPFFFDNPYLKKLAEASYYLPLNKIVNSIWLRNLIEEKYGTKLHIVNPAINHEIFYPRDMTNDSNKFRILCFGRQTIWKGFPYALEAINLVRKHRADIEFIAFGTKKPTYKSGFPFEFVNSPTDEELANLYSSCDMIICPSWYESFPLYPLEAMACGLPVITTPFGTEDYALDGKNCLVVPPKDPKKLADAILVLLNDENLRESFKKEGLRCVKKFTWDATIADVENIYLSALKNS